MKNKMFWLAILIILAVLATGFAMLIGCGQASSTSNSTALKLSLLGNASTTTPVFEPSVTGSSIKGQSTWGSGPLYSVYFSLREFLASRDEGIVDRSNLYKLLADVDTVLSGAQGIAVTSFAEKEITPPFNKLQKMVCDQAGNDTANKVAVARKETTNETNAILTWIWSDSASKEEYGIASVYFNKSTKDLSIDMVYSVDYDLGDTTTDYNLRCNVTGNAASNEFQFKYIIGDNKIVSKGISRGEGNYMLFKYQGGSDPVRYLVVPSSADENFFVEQSSNATELYSDQLNLPASVEAYKDWVINTDFFSASDLMSDKSLLNSGNSKQGTIYIDY